ncbi:MAG TPA: FAD-binding oxidoreductase [Acidobacteriaceae bacterium]
MASSSAVNSSLLREQLSALTGSEYVRRPRSAEAIGGILPAWIVTPGSEQEVASVLHLANEMDLAVIPRGGGSKLAWGNPPRGADLVLSLERLNRVEEHAWADLTVTVQAGCTIESLQQTLALHKQRLAIDPLWPHRATVGGVLSANDTGAMRLCFGALRDLVIGITLALPDGTLAKSGGKVVKNVAGYDLPKLTTGAGGTLGVITRAIFRVHPLPAKTQTLSIRAETLNGMQRLILALLGSNVAFSAIQVRAASASVPVIDVALEGTDAGLPSQVDRIQGLASPALAGPEDGSVWAARERLWLAESGAANAGPSDGAVVKISVIPSAIQNTLAMVERSSAAHRAAWRAVIQGTGIGWISLEADAAHFPELLEQLRTEIEGEGGSLVVQRLPFGAQGLDVWGNPGDALPLMRALKDQFDPKSTLNPGRYVGGI